MKDIITEGCISTDWLISTWCYIRDILTAEDFVGCSSRPL